jgi:hypothetical protein
MSTHRLNIRHAVALAVAAAFLLATPFPRGYASTTCSQKKHPEFKDYSAAQIFNGTLHPAILTTHIEKNHRTVIREALEKGVNFAGHYVLVSWGCGAGCKQFVIVDSVTGKVYDPPFVEVYYHFPPANSNFEWWCYTDLLTFNKGSRLLVVEGCLAGKRCGRTYFLWEDSLKQLSYDPDLLPNGSVTPF